MKDRKMKAKAILFDLDGTIFDITEREAFARYEALCQWVTVFHQMKLGNTIVMV